MPPPRKDAAEVRDLHLTSLGAAHLREPDAAASQGGVTGGVAARKLLVFRRPSRLRTRERLASPFAAEATAAELMRTFLRLQTTNPFLFFSLFNILSAELKFFVLLSLASLRSALSTLMVVGRKEIARRLFLRVRGTMM